MSQPRDWRVIMAELNAENAQNNDSLELGDSWRAMPRRTEGVVNKTNGLYRRSALPALPVKNLYNFIIEKQPTDGRKTVTDSAPAPVTHPPPKLLTPSVEPITPENGENSDNLEFSQFLTAQNDGHKAVTSTPYPVRQIDANKSPKRTVNVQRSAADSPKKLFVPAPTRIPIGTPRSSKQLNNAGRRAIQPSDRNKMSSPTSVVSSTVHIVSDDDESERVKSPEKQLNVRKDERLPVIESAPDENCLPLDEDQQEQNDGTKKNAQEALFRRPDMVRRPLIKQTKLEPGDDQSKISNSTNNTQRSKKSKSNVNPLLEGYIKVGESITNRTNSVPLESSSSSTRRRLYKKGDSCNEEDILKDIEPLEQPSFVVNPVSAGYNGTFTKAKSISVQPNATVDGDLKSGNDARVEALIQDPKETAEPHAELTETIQPPGTERNGIVDLTFEDGSENQSKLSDDGQEPTNSQKAHSNASPSSNDDQESVSDAPDQNTPSSDSPSGDDVHESTTDVQSPSANSNGKQVDDTEKDHPTVNSTDQQNHMSAQHSSKRDLDEILQDWSDTVKPSNDQELVDRSGSSDSELEIHPPTVKKPSAKSKVRQVRSNSTKKPGTGTTSSKAGRRGTVRPNLDQIDENDETEEDELSTASADVRNLTKNASNAKEAKKRTRKELPTKSKGEPIHSTQQEVIENDDDSDDSEQPSIDKLPRANTQRAEESKAKPPNKTRSKRDDIETDGDGVELSTKSKRKGNKQRAVDGNEPGADRKETDSKGASKGRERKDRDEDIVVEGDSVLPARQMRKQRLNAEGNETETDGKKTKAVTASKGDKTNTDGDAMEIDDIEPAVAATSKSKGRKKRPNAEDDVLEEVEIEAESARTSKRNQRKKRPAAEEAVEAETELPTTSKSREKKRRLNAQNDATEDEAETELVTRSSKRKDNKKPANAEDNVRETDGNEAEQSKKSRTGKTGKKRVDVEEIAAEDDIEPQIEIGDSPAEDDTGNDTQSTAKSKVRKSQKRKHQSVADGKNLSTEQGGNFSSRVDGSMAKKRRKITKWERASESIFNYNSLKPREAATGIRQSSRERRIPANNLLLNLPIANAISSNRTALQRQNGSVQHRVQRRNQSVHTEGENVFSMLLNGSMDKEPPLITNLDGIEITQGFHKTVKNNLIIHHIPGETGPSYGYFTLEPGMVKRACRITWNLHIHVVSGPIQIITNDKSEQMVTGSFASLHSGTKYSLRNDGENSALVFFSQQANG